MPAIIPLAKLIGKFGKSQGRMIHSLMQETGLSLDPIKRLLKQSKAGRYAKDYDWDNLFWHGTPDWSVSRKALDPKNLSQASRKAKESHIEDLVGAGQGGEILSPIGSIRPSSYGNLMGGSYITGDPLFAFKMGLRKTSPPVTFPFTRDATSPLWRTSNIPLLLKKNAKFIENKDFLNKIDDVILRDSRPSLDEAWESAVMDLAGEGYTGVKQMLPAIGRGWSSKDRLEYALWNDLEDIRHPLAQFENPMKGIFGGLLPLISLLRGQREE